MVKYGIDVSEHNGDINWKEVKNAGRVDFVMIRAGYGRSAIDRKFHINASMCNSLDIPIGIYWFSYASRPGDAEKEAELCIDTIKQYKITYPVAFDFEDDSVRVAKKNGVYVSQEFASNMAIAFLTRIKQAGYKAILYSNPSYLIQYFDSKVRELFPLWLAQWPAYANPENRPVSSPEIWQYSEKGRIPGISTNVDMNASYVDYLAEESIDVTNPSEKEMQTLVAKLNFEKQKSWFEKENNGAPSYQTLAKEFGFTDGTRPYEIPSRAEVMTMIIRAMIKLRDETGIGFEKIESSMLDIESKLNKEDGE